MIREIIVCTKQSVTTDLPLRVTSDGRNLENDSIRWIMNEADRVPLEAALQAREQGNVERVTCICVGPTPANETLAYCLAAGANRALRIDFPDELFPSAAVVGTLLAAAVRQLNGELVFAAQQSSDGQSGLVPAYTAKALDAAYLSNTVSAEIGESGVKTRRKLERGHRQVWRAALPAVIAFDQNTNSPRYVSVAALMIARRRRIETITPEALGVSRETGPESMHLTRLAPARTRTKKVRSPLSTQSAAERMHVLSMGGARSTDKEPLQGAPDELAAQIVTYLEARGLLDL